MRRELPRVVRRRLEQAVSAFSGPLENQLRSQLVNIVRDAQSEVFELYRRRESSQGVGGPTPSEQPPMSLSPDRLGSPLESQDPLRFMNFDFSAFEPQPPVEDYYINPERLDLPRPTTTDLTGNQLSLSDSGYGTSNVGLLDVAKGAEADSVGDALIWDPNSQDSSN